MERQLPGFEMVHVVDRAEDFRNWLPQLTELLEQVPILLVLDNLGKPADRVGKWRDERWGMLIAAILAPGGLSPASS